MVRQQDRVTPRYDGVDVLRGLSIIAVVLLHGFIRLFLTGHSIRPLLPAWLFRLVFLNGGNGVTVFFVVSGFLITYTSLRRFGTLQGMVPRAFYRIRFARIAPLLLLIVAVLSVLHLVHAEGFRIAAGRASLPRAIFATLTFHLNWLEAKHGYLPPNWDVMWSLSIEEMFYVFFPLVCLLLLRFRHGMAIFVTLLLTLLVLAPLGRTVWAADDVAAEKSYLGGMGCIAMGCLAALLLRHWQTRGTAPSDNKLLALAWAGAAVMFLAGPPFSWAWHAPLGRTDLDDSLLALGAGMFILATVQRNRPGRRWTAPLRWFGRHSYEVYLTHEFVVVWITLLYARVDGTNSHRLLLWIALMLTLSAPLGWATAKFFSEPMNRRLRRTHTAA